MKRLFDIVASLIGLIVLSPLFIVLAIAVKRSSPGPIFYRATRVGRFGTLFKAYKFRSMVINADQVGPKVTVSGDSRITDIGRFLRKSKLDELPQLINVLKGDMSVVGPRPEDPRYVALYTEEQRQVLNVRPGITSPASVKFRSEEELLVSDDWEKQYIEEIMPAKLKVDLDYVANANLLQDIKIILQTIRSL